MLHLPRVMLAAPASGSGKTMITCGILEALKNQGQNPVSFKCGPDYIDPMFHTRILGTPSRNLDTFFTDREMTRFLFARKAREAGISVMEGVMGFYDGLGGIRKEASSYDLARVTQTPVVLVINAKGMSLSVLPLIKGFLEYQEEAVIQGVILNRVAASTAALLKGPIEAETGLTFLGYVPELESCRIESRHLGLVTPGEIADLQGRVKSLAAELEKTLDFGKLAAIAASAPDYGEKEAEQPERVARLCRQAPAEPVRIGVAWDEAFCFYYQDNLELFEILGAELSYFSPLRDRRLPWGISGLLLGGGYPELYAGKLSGNKDLRTCIRAALEEGMPCLAECGGFMYLQEEMEDMEGNCWPMVGALRGKAYRTLRLGRFGYITLQAGAGQLLSEGTEIRGHEFHYFDCTDPGSAYLAEKPVTGRSWACIHGSERGTLGYPHLYYWSNPEFAARFVRRAEDFRTEGGHSQGAQCGG